MMEENIEDTIVMLYNEKKWEDIVNLNYTSSRIEKCRLFWVLPTVNDLNWITEILRDYNLSGIVSIGCGCGLFEWLLQKYSGLHVTGVELDRSWWCSKYSPPLFLENIIFIQDSKTKTFRVSDDYALLFCYFNNPSAFCSYMENYAGNLVFVIGPKEGQDRWTDPLPFDQKFEQYGWKFIGKREFERTMDYIVAYSRPKKY